MKTFGNNFKGRAEALKMYLALLRIGNGGEDAHRRWNRRPESVARFEIKSKDI